MTNEISQTRFDRADIKEFKADRIHEFWLLEKSSKGWKCLDLTANNCNFILYKKAIESIPSRTNAVDVGCRDGEFSRYLTWTFDHVYCFDYQLSSFFARNVNLNKATHYKVALGKEHSQEIGSGRNNFRNPFFDVPYRQRMQNDSTFDTILPLDSFNLKNVGLIKIDVDGMELEVLEGAMNTIKEYRPIIIIEELIMNNGKINLEGLSYLKQHGYTEIFKHKTNKVHTDYIFQSKK
jgi:FkbM family methyltransferase